MTALNRVMAELVTILGHLLSKNYPQLNKYPNQAADDLTEQVTALYKGLMVHKICTTFENSHQLS